MLGFLREKIMDTANGAGGAAPAPENPPERGCGAGCIRLRERCDEALQYAKLWRNRVDVAGECIDRLSKDRDEARVERDEAQRSFKLTNIREVERERDNALEDLKLMQDIAGRAQDRFAKIERDGILDEMYHASEQRRLRSALDQTIDELEREREAHDLTDQEYDRYTIAQQAELAEARKVASRAVSRNRLYEQEVYAAGREIERLRNQVNAKVSG